LIKSRRFGWAGHVNRMEEGMVPFKMLTVTRNSVDSAKNTPYWRAIVNTAFNLRVL